MKHIAVVIPYSRQAWRKTQDREFFQATLCEPVLDVPTGYNIDSVNVLACAVKCSIRTPYPGLRVHENGYDNESRAIRLFLDSQQARDADLFLYVGLGVSPIRDSLLTLIKNLGKQPLVYGRVVCYTSKESYGAPLEEKELYEPEDESNGFVRRFRDCPISPLFLGTRAFLETLDPELSGSYLLDASARNLGSETFIDTITGTSKFRIIDFGHPRSGEEGIWLSTRWKALSPRSQTRTRWPVKC